MRVALFAQGREAEGYGHIGRCLTVYKFLAEQPQISGLVLIVDGDEYVLSKASCAGVTIERSGVYGSYIEYDAVIFDGYHLSVALKEELASHPLSICISPKVSALGIFKMWFLRSPPDVGSYGGSGTRVLQSPGYGLLSPRAAGGSDVDGDGDGPLVVGISLGGGSYESDINSLLAVIRKISHESELRILNSPWPIDNKEVGEVSFKDWCSDPWSNYFVGIHLFIGAGGVLCLEALANGVPVIEINTPDNLSKNAELANPLCYLQLVDGEDCRVATEKFLEAVEGGVARQEVGRFVASHRGGSLAEDVLMYITGEGSRQ